jgi:hypothetical protein
VIASAASCLAARAYRAGARVRVLSSATQFLLDVVQHGSLNILFQPETEDKEPFP